MGDGLETEGQDDRPDLADRTVLAVAPRYRLWRFTAAARAGKPVFVDFYGSWCTNCRAFQKRTQSDPELNTALASAVLLKIYDTSPDFSKYKSDQRFPELNVGLPFFLITDAEGHVLYKTSDFTRVDEMKLFLSSS